MHGPPRVECGGSSGDPDAGAMLDAAAHDAFVATDAGAEDGAAPFDATVLDAALDAGLDAGGSDAGRDAGPFDAGPPALLAWDWEWMNRRPQGNTLYGSSLSSSGSGWAVGGRGTTLRYAGGAWTLVPCPTVERIRVVAAVTDDLAFAADERGTLLRWDGAAWRVEPVTPGLSPNAMWAASPSFVVAVGTGVARWDGASWESVPIVPASALYAVHGVSASDYWAVGEDAVVLHCDGSACSPSSAPAGDYYAVFARTASDAWIAGNGVVAHWDGASWTAMTDAPAGYYSSIFARAADDVWLGRTNGGMVHYDGATFSASSTTNAWKIAGSGANAIAAGYSVYHLGSTGWVQDGADDVRTTLEAVWGSGPNDVWMGSRAAAVSVLRWDGTAIRAGPVPIASGGTMAIDGTAADDVWLVGYRGFAAHWDGTSATRAPMMSGFTDTFAGVVALPGGRAIASTEGGSVYELTLAGATSVYTGSVPLHGVWAASPSDIFVAAGDGSVLHYDGASWTPMSTGVTTALHGVWGRGATDVYVVGDEGVVLRYDGSAWTAIPSGSTTIHFRDVEGDATRLWMVGMEAGSGQGEIWYLEAGLLREQVPGTTGWLNAIDILPSGEAWTVGFASQVLRRAP